MSPGEKLEHILATILLAFVAIIMVTTCSKAMAGDHHHDHGRSTDYIVINKENFNAKEFAIGIAVTTTLVCAYKRFVQGDPCYKSKARKTTEADDKVTP